MSNSSTQHSMAEEERVDSRVWPHLAGVKMEHDNNGTMSLHLLLLGAQHPQPAGKCNPENILMKTSESCGIHRGKGALFIAGRNINYFSHCGNQYGDSLFKKMKIELHATSLQLLGTCLKDSQPTHHRNTCTFMFIAERCS